MQPLSKTKSSVYLWGWGNLSGSRASNSGNSKQKAPLLIESLSTEHIKSASADGRSIGVISQSGSLFVWELGYDSRKLKKEIQSHLRSHKQYKRLDDLALEMAGKLSANPTVQMSDDYLMSQLSQDASPSSSKRVSTDVLTRPMEVQMSMLGANMLSWLTSASGAGLPSEKMAFKYCQTMLRSGLIMDCSGSSGMSLSMMAASPKTTSTTTATTTTTTTTTSSSSSTSSLKSIGSVGSSSEIAALFNAKHYYTLSHDQCVRSVSEYMYNFIPVCSDLTLKVTRVSSTQTHCFVVTEDGQLYYWRLLGAGSSTSTTSTAVAGRSTSSMTPAAGLSEATPPPSSGMEASITAESGSVTPSMLCLLNLDEDHYGDDGFYTAEESIDPLDDSVSDLSGAYRKSRGSARYNHTLTVSNVDEDGAGDGGMTGFPDIDEIAKTAAHSYEAVEVRTGSMHYLLDSDVKLPISELKQKSAPVESDRSSPPKRRAPPAPGSITAATATSVKPKPQGSTSKVATPASDDPSRRSSSALMCSVAPTLFPLKSAVREPIRGISCGHKFAVAWTASGLMYSWGIGMHGRLGLGDTMNRQTPTLISRFSSDRICCETRTTVIRDGLTGLAHRYGQVTGAASSGGSAGDDGQLTPRDEIQRDDEDDAKRGDIGMIGDSEDEESTTIDDYISEEKTRVEVPMSDRGVRSDVSTAAPKMESSSDAEFIYVCEVVAGFDHCVALTAEGHLYSWGNNQSGRLGIGKSVEYQSVPQRIFVHGVREMDDGGWDPDVIARAEHAADAARWRDDFPVFGDQDDGEDDTLHSITVDSRRLDESEDARDEMRVSSSIVLAGTGARSPVVPRLSIDMSTQKMNNNNSKNGINEMNSTTTMMMQPEPVFTDVAVGYAHNLAVVAGTGQVYVWGGNMCGQLGTGDCDNRYTPTMLPDIDSVSTVACGAFHSAAIRLGDVYCWGRNENGQCGVDADAHRDSGLISEPGTPLVADSLITASRLSPVPVSQEILRPAQVAYLSGMDCTSIVCGSDFTFAVAMNGVVLKEDYFTERGKRERESAASALKASLSKSKLIGGKFANLKSEMKSFLDSTAADTSVTNAKSQLMKLGKSLTKLRSIDDLKVTGGSSAYDPRPSATTDDDEKSGLQSSSSMSRSSRIQARTMDRARSFVSKMEAKRKQKKGGMRSTDPDLTLKAGSAAISVSLGQSRLKRIAKAATMSGSSLTGASSSSSSSSSSIGSQKKRSDIANAKYWATTILPEFHAYRQSRKLIESVWKYGIPREMRGKVWSLLIGNRLDLNHDLIQILIDKGRKLEGVSDLAASSLSSSAESDLTPAMRSKEKSISMIDTDLDRTFSSMSLFQKGGLFQDTLRDLLRAYVYHRPDHGYLQGMSFVMGHLLLYMDSDAAFVAFSNLMAQPWIQDFTRIDQGKHLGRFELFTMILEHCLPKLYEAMMVKGDFKINLDMFFLDWAISLFTKRVDLTVAARLWDVILFEGEIAFYKCSIGLLSAIEQKCQLSEKSSGEILKLLSRDSVSLLEASEIMLIARQVRFNKKIQDALSRVGSSSAFPSL